MLEVFLLVVGACVAVALLLWLGWWQATRGMTDEEKHKLAEYIEKNGFLGSDDWF